MNMDYMMDEDCGRKPKENNMLSNEEIDKARENETDKDRLSQTANILPEADFLSELILKQKLFSERIGRPLTALTFKESEKLSKEYILAIIAESIELLDWMNWKIWKKERVEYDSLRIKEIQFELIDLLCFWANLCILWNLTPEKIIKTYR